MFLLLLRLETQTAQLISLAAAAANWSFSSTDFFSFHAAAAPSVVGSAISHVFLLIFP